MRYFFGCNSTGRDEYMDYTLVWNLPLLEIYEGSINLILLEILWGEYKPHIIRNSWGYYKPHIIKNSWGYYKPPIIKNSWGGGGSHVFMFYQWRMQNYVCLEYISFLSLSLDIIVTSLIMSEKRIKTDLCKQKQFLINNEQTKHFFVSKQIYNF